MTHRRLRSATSAPALFAVLAIFVAACAGPAASPGASAPPPIGPSSAPSAPSSAGSSAAPSAGASANPSSAPSGAATPTADPATTAARAAIEARAWGSASLVDVETGATFRIADFAGRTVFIESMAIWCTNCRAQQGRFREALAQLDPTEVAYVVLTVDPSETADALKAYRAQQGFTGSYAVAGRDVAGALVADFGPNAINPPAVPLVLIRPDGTIEFRTGAESVEDILVTVRG